MNHKKLKKTPEFQKIQYQFAKNLRNPEQNSAPSNIEARRMKVYQELFYNNIENFCRNSFPILHSLTKEDKWHRMVRDFFTNHRASSPYFIDISREFLTFITAHRKTEEDDQSFMLELADWEYMEIIASKAKCDIREVAHDRNGDLFTQNVVISPLAWARVYQFPVHKIGQSFQPQTTPEIPTYLIITRNRKHNVDFFESNALTYHLLMLFKQYDEKKQQVTGQQALQELVEITQFPNPEQLIQGGKQILRDLMEREVILGVNSN